MSLGAKVVTASDSGGTVIDEAGFTPDKLALLMEIKKQNFGRVETYAKQLCLRFETGQKPWGIAANIAGFVKVADTMMAQGV